MEGHEKMLQHDVPHSCARRQNRNSVTLPKTGQKFQSKLGRGQRNNKGTAEAFGN